MMTSLALDAEQESTALVPSANPLVLLQSAIDRGLDPDKLGKLMDLAERWERNQAAAAFGTALANFQAECPRVTKSRTADAGGRFSYKYASYEDVMAAAGPLLAKCGLSVTFTNETTDKGNLRVTCQVRHGTHTQETTVQIPIPDMRVNDTQKYGAAVSYAKRFALCSALNIVIAGEDNDAKNQYEPIDEKQLGILKHMLDVKKVNVRKFLEWAACESVEDLPKAKYAEAIDMLQRKESPK